jgi:hypothetical protein
LQYTIPNQKKKKILWKPKNVVFLTEPSYWQATKLQGGVGKGMANGPKSQKPTLEKA